MSQKELLSSSVKVALTTKQLKKLEKKAQNEVLTISAFTRQHLVKSLKLQE